MKFDENTYDKIDRYLNNQMTGEELTQFELEKNANKMLADEIEVNAQMKEFLSDSPENRLRKNLKSLANDFEEKEEAPISINRNNYFTMLFRVAAAILIAGMLWWVYSKSVNSPNREETPIVKTPVDLSPDDKNEGNRVLPDPTIVNTDVAKDDDGEVDKTDNDAVIKLPKKEEEEINPKYIAADFEVNPSLDFLIANNQRSNDIQFEVKRKVGNISLSSLKDIVEFRFSGVMSTNKDLLQDEIKLHLFSNKKVDYEDFTPIISVDLALKQSGQDYEFDIQKSVLLKPGLYYYVVEDENEKTYFVEKFEVRR